MFEATDRRAVVAWAFYDWANSAFATTVMAGFFPLFFKAYWAAGADPTVSTLRLGWANSLASIVVAAMSPILGAIADQGTAKKRFLIFFATMGSVMTGALFLVSRGEWVLAVLLYVGATIGFSGGNCFYDALIVSVAPIQKVDIVSALGFALGYLGGGLLFAANILMYRNPAAFGIPDSETAVRVSFITVAIWWAAFSIPLMLFVKEPRVEGSVSGWAAVGQGLRRFRATLGELRRLRLVGLFLAAYWLYIDGVDTVVRMAVDYGMNLGFDSGSLIVALLLTQFVGFPAAIAFGKLGERIGSKKGIFVGIVVYVVIIGWGSRMTQEWEFFALAICIGLVQGGVQSLSRALYARIIPRDGAAQFFGFYNMLGKFAAVIGPSLMGVVGVLTGSPRLALLSVMLLFIAGGSLLYFVDEDAARAAANG